MLVEGSEVRSEVLPLVVLVWKRRSRPFGSLMLLDIAIGRKKRARGGLKGGGRHRSSNRHAA